MPNLRKRKASRLALLLITVLWDSGCFAQRVAVAAVRIARPAEAKAAQVVAGKLLPAEARDVHFDSLQAVVVAGSPEMTILPVLYRSPVQGAIVEGAMVSQCGLVIVSSERAPSLVMTVGVGNTEMMTCTRIKAVGGVPVLKPGLRPNILFLYDTYTGRQSDVTTILLTWNEKSGTYAVDDATSEWLGEHKEGRTIAGARHLLM